MKVEHFLYGMFHLPEQGWKIIHLKTDGVNNLLTDVNSQKLRDKKVRDSNHYLWLPTEQVVALPHIELADDGEGRDWVQNHTAILPIHQYLQLTDPLQHNKAKAQIMLSQLSVAIRNLTVPEKFDPIILNDGEAT